ncbi:TPA: hypothetical protein ACH3X3_011291 [Trebouxia sp. C0006]
MCGTQFGIRGWEKFWGSCKAGSSALVEKFLRAELEWTDQTDHQGKAGPAGAGGS